MRRWKPVMAVTGALACVSAIASLPFAPAERRATVVFDEAHDQRFLVEHEGALGLSRLAEVLRDERVAVTTTRVAIGDETLASADGLVISGAFAAITRPEIDATKRFLRRGGRVSVMLHIAAPVDALLYDLDVLTSNGVVRERENVIADDPLNFRVTRLSGHELTVGLDGFDVFGAWALLGYGANSALIARTSPRAWVDLNGDRNLGARDAVQSFGVAVSGQLGRGAFVVFGDDALFQNRFLGDRNALLARRLARWLGGGPHDTDAPRDHDGERRSEADPETRAPVA